MKRFLICVLIFLYALSATTYASNPNDELKIDEFLEDIKSYTSDILPELSDENILENIIAGETFDSKNLLKRIANILIGEVKTAITIIFSILAISLLCGVLKNIQSSFGSNVSEIAFYVCYLVVVILIIDSYTSIIEICRETIVKLNDFMGLLIPLVLGLLVANRKYCFCGNDETSFIGNDFCNKYCCFKYHITNNFYCDNDKSY